MKLKKLTFISIIILTFLFIFTCAPKPEELIIGTWEGQLLDYTNYKLEVMEDETYKAYWDIDGSQIEAENGTWSIEEDSLMLTVVNIYNETDNELQPIENGDIETQEYSFGIDEDDLSLFALTPGEDADIESLIGEWTGRVSFSFKGSTDTDFLEYSFTFLEEELVEIVIKDTSAEETITGTWNYDKETLKMTITPDGEDPINFDVEIVGNTVSLYNSESSFISYGYVLDKVETE
jgi:hypothetical protein